MKKQIAFMGAAAAALMMAGTAHADGGYVGLSYSDNSDADVNAWGVDGAFAASNFQFDGSYGRDSTSFGDLDVWGVGGHLFSRNDTWLWGGYLGFDRVEGGGASIDQWTAALQTQYYMPRTTLSGNLSYSKTSDFPVVGDLDTWELNGEARFFATDNFSFQGNLGYGDVSGDFDFSGNYWSYGVGAEWQADSFPVSVYAAWQSFNLGGDFDGSPDTWTIGIRYNWGGTLLQRNRSGAGLSAPHGFEHAVF